MTYVFDIDGTVCSQVKDGDYLKAKPYKHRIKKINDLYRQGAIIIFNTARGMGRYENNSKKAHESFYELTVKQLNSWGVKYHKLFLGKPSGDIYIDDKGVNDEDFFDARD
jgi:capsule biosynthesis phosphatase